MSQILKGCCSRNVPRSLKPQSSYMKPRSSSTFRGTFTRRQYKEKVISHILDRKWALSSPQSKVHEILVSHAREGHGGISSDLFSFSNNLYPSLGEEFNELRQWGNSFYIIRDDLLHPLMSGNKTRKLDALLPLIESHLVTDVVTCGGCQSAHTAAVAVACAERGMRSHLLLRGEKPEISTGYNLISGMYGNVVYVPRSIYANREDMLAKHANEVAGHNGSIMWLHNEVKMPYKNQSIPLDASKGQLPSVVIPATPKKVAVVKEGGSDAISLLGRFHSTVPLIIKEITGLEDKVMRPGNNEGNLLATRSGLNFKKSKGKLKKPDDLASAPAVLLGRHTGYLEYSCLIRLVDYLAQPSIFGTERSLQIVVDSGTGTTAVGLAIGALLFSLKLCSLLILPSETILPWKVIGVMLADTIEGYKKHEARLLSDFKKVIVGEYDFNLNENPGDHVQWVERCLPRKFGKIYKEELEICKQIAQQTGVLVDPVYTLASWEHAALICQNTTRSNASVVMLHTGGTLGLFGLAQRYKSYFDSLQGNNVKNDSSNCSKNSN
eukprot:Gb_20289 [translate_table: standard]